MAFLDELLGNLAPKPKPPTNGPGSLLSMLNIAPTDATAVNNRPQYPQQRTIGPVTRGNVPLPEATVQSRYQPRYDKAMSFLSDMLPVLGDARSIVGGAQQAMQGHPIAGGLMAAAGMLPMGGRIAGAAEREAEGALAHSLAPPARDAVNYTTMNAREPQQLVYRGITGDEASSIAKNGHIQSTMQFSHPSEGTSFGQDYYTAEDAVNFGRTNPAKTGRPNYVLEVKSGPDIRVDPRDYYPKAQTPIPADRITRAWQHNPNGSVVPVRLGPSGWEPIGTSSNGGSK